MSKKNKEIQAKYAEIEAEHTEWTDTSIVAELSKYFNGTEIATWINQIDWDEKEE